MNIEAGDILQRGCDIIVRYTDGQSDLPSNAGSLASSLVSITIASYPLCPYADQ